MELPLRSVVILSLTAAAMLLCWTLWMLAPLPATYPTGATAQHAARAVTL